MNPRYESVCGVPCFPILAALPEPVEHVIFAVSDARVEAALDEVIAHGARAATMMSSLVLEDDQPAAAARARARENPRSRASLVCGANGMGFYNFIDGVWACGFQTREHARGGNVAYISHSGSGMCGIVDSDERIDFNLVVSTGQELAGHDGRVPGFRARAALDARRRAVHGDCAQSARARARASKRRGSAGFRSLR